MKDLHWVDGYAGKWDWPIYDEPEDYPDAFPAFLAAHDGRPVALAYWDIAKAKKLGVWREDRATVLLFNWYPAVSAVPSLFRWAYVPFKTLEYRLLHSQRRIPCYLSLWTKERGEVTDEHGYKYWYSGCWNWYAFLTFRVLLWPRETGRAWF